MFVCVYLAIIIHHLITLTETLRIGQKLVNCTASICTRTKPRLHSLLIVLKKLYIEYRRSILRCLSFTATHDSRNFVFGLRLNGYTRDNPSRPPCSAALKRLNEWIDSQLTGTAQIPSSKPPNNWSRESIHAFCASPHFRELSTANTN